MTTKPACVGADPALFDPLTYEATQQGPPEQFPRIAKALRYCRRCPVTEWCSEQGAHSAGVWGGRYVTRESLRGKGIAA